MQEDIESVFEENNLDAIIYPTVACPPTPITTADGSSINDPTFVCNLENIQGDQYRAGYLADLTGFPDITVPAGFTDTELTVGLSFFGQAYSEPTLLGFAYAYEQATMNQQPSSLVPPLPGEVIKYQPVPEPSVTPAVAILGLSALGIKFRKHRKKQGEPQTYFRFPWNS